MRKRLILKEYICDIQIDGMDTTHALDAINIEREATELAGVYDSTYLVDNREKGCVEMYGRRGETEAEYLSRVDALDDIDREKIANMQEEINDLAGGLGMLVSWDMVPISEVE